MDKAADPMRNESDQLPELDAAASREGSPASSATSPK
jgi:hypothetical protein